MSIIKNILKTKIKSHSGEVTDFYNKEFRKVDSNHNCLAVIKSANTFKKNLLDTPIMVLREQFWKCIFWGGNFENILCIYIHINWKEKMKTKLYKNIYWRKNFDKYLITAIYLLISSTQVYHSRIID